MLTFSYHLDTAGWADATITDGARRVDLTASFLSDALGDLARAVVALLRGANHVEVTWLSEPGVAEWRVDRDGENVDITIILFDDWVAYRAGRARRVDQPFVAQCPLVRLAKEVLDELWQLLQSVGIDGYKQRWKKHDFPITEYEQLKGLLREWKRLSREG